MNEDIVKIKGIKQGLLLTFASGADFDRIEKELEDKMISGFFIRGTPVYIKPNTLRKDQEKRLKKLFNGYALIFKVEDPGEQGYFEMPKEPHFSSPMPTEKENTPAKVAVIPESYKEEMLVINRTIRGGQEIRTKSSVLICGNVNPGAQVIAGGSIDIRGKCLGMVHAGAFGNKDAFIIADRLLPTQIRIANLVARAPDDSEGTTKAERASIKDGQIVIDPIER